MITAFLNRKTGQLRLKKAMLVLFAVSFFFSLNASKLATAQLKGSAQSDDTGETDTEPAGPDDGMPDIEEEPQELVPPTEVRFKPGLAAPYRPVQEITRAEKPGMELAITFDGGYESEDALEILDILKERGIKTTVFLTGVFIKKYPGIVKRIVDDGHEAGNHTMDHPHLTEYAGSYRQTTLSGVDREMVQRELKEASDLFLEATGKRMAPLWRAPYGEINDDIRLWAYEAGYIHVGWTYDNRRHESLDSLDWVTNTSSRLYLSSQGIKRRILGFEGEGQGIKGGIILMHLGTGRLEQKAVSVLPEILDELMSQGYRFVQVSSMVDRAGIEYVSNRYQGPAAPDAGPVESAFLQDPLPGLSALLIRA